MLGSYSAGSTEAICIQAKLYGSLAARLGNGRDVRLKPPCSVLSLIQALGIDSKEVSLSVVNGVQVSLTASLNDGDKVMIVPAVIGG